MPLLFSGCDRPGAQKKEEADARRAGRPAASPLPEKSADKNGPRVIPVLNGGMSVVKPEKIHPVSPVKPLSLPPKPLPPMQADIVKIRSQLDEILKQNENLKSRYREHVIEIQKVSEQAAIHQRMLAQIEAARQAAKLVAPADIQEAIRQEKVRIIEQETQENRRFLDNLNQSHKNSQ